uniref:Variant surface glycoprotein 1310 n=1 Tax=Trypanosoma brucei TaxID=5691 RepID=M4SV53_9TRYP|nr:variant surface glycoprotein 1310 [Trypanosoma brucei]
MHISAFYLAACLGQIATANKAALKVDGFTKMCELSGNLKKVHSYATSTITAQRANIKNMDDLVTDMVIIIRENSTDGLENFKELALYGRRLRQAENQRLTGFAEKAPAAAATATYTAGLFDQTASIFWQATQNAGSGDYCIAQASGGGKQSAVSALSGCIKADHTMEHLTGTEGTDTPDINANNGDFAAGNHASPNDSSNKCALTQKDSNGGYGHTNGLSQNIKWAGGLLTFGDGELSTNPWTDISTSLESVKPLEAAQKAFSDMTDHAASAAGTMNFLKLKEQNKQAFAVVKTNRKELGLGEDQTPLTITAEQQEAIRQKIKSYRDGVKQPTQLEKHREAFRIQTLTTVEQPAGQTEPTQCRTESKDGAPVKEKDCSQHVNKTPTECKNLGCEHDPATNTCKPRTRAETTAETTTEKCKGKPEKDCKSPDCKWEG